MCLQGMLTAETRVSREPIFIETLESFQTLTDEGLKAWGFDVKKKGFCSVFLKLQEKKGVFLTDVCGKIYVTKTVL